MAGVIETERELRASFEETARERLGPHASEAEITEWVDNAYYGTSQPRQHIETPEEREARKQRTAEDIELMDRWNVPEL